MSHLSRIYLTILTILCVSTPAAATVMIRFDTAELTRRSSVIVEGQVLSQRALLVDGKPWTETRVRISKRHLGRVTPGHVIRVMQIGGTVQDLGLKVSGTAKFKNDEKVLLFLIKRADRATYATVGMAQGKYTLFTDAHGVKRVKRDMHELVFAYRHKGKTVLQPEWRLASAHATSLDWLRKQILSATKLKSKAGGAR